MLNDLTPEEKIEQELKQLEAKKASLLEKAKSINLAINPIIGELFLADCYKNPEIAKYALGLIDKATDKQKAKLAGTVKKLNEAVATKPVTLTQVIEQPQPVEQATDTNNNRTN